MSGGGVELKVERVLLTSEGVMEIVPVKHDWWRGSC